MLEIALLPTITRIPAAFPRQWPCLGGRFRELGGLFHTVRLTWNSMVLLQVHWVPTGFGSYSRNILFYETTGLLLFEQLKCSGNLLKSLPNDQIFQNHFTACPFIFMLQLCGVCKVQSVGHMSCCCGKTERAYLFTGFQSPPPHIYICCNQVKTHFFQELLCITYSLCWITSSSPLSVKRDGKLKENPTLWVWVTIYHLMP